MKKINEQSKRYGAPISHAPQMPSPTPKTTFNKTPYINKTVNLYKDKNETQLIRQVKIKDVIPKGKFIEISTNMVVPYTYDCGELYLKPSAGEFYLLYNKKLTDKLKTDFCTKSSGGANVPKADFASNGQPAQGQTMAEGKKVIRITEEGLARLVNKVLNEQSSVIRKCNVYDQGFLLVKLEQGVANYVLSKSKSGSDAFCVVDPSVIKNWGKKGGNDDYV